MKILVTGANGQLGSELRLRTGDHPGFEFIFTDIAELDITNEEAVESVVISNKIDAIINCAAYTAVDKAEKEKPLAILINATAVEKIARVAAKHAVLLIHISTDYVFDGKGHRPYLEDDETHPVSAYAESKCLGEQAIQASSAKALILRTSWLYSSFGSNFVKTMIRLAKEQGLIKVVSDQVGSPTYAGDLAAAILDILESHPAPEGVEIYNYANEGVASWYDFAKAIIEFTGITCEVIPIETKDFKTLAARPFYSVFNKSKIKSKFHPEIPYWRESLQRCIEKITNDEARITN
jgi:dTDP-4-dehydrorhamnose reductase